MERPARVNDASGVWEGSAGSSSMECGGEGARSSASSGEGGGVPERDWLAPPLVSTLRRNCCGGRGFGRNKVAATAPEVGPADADADADAATSAPFRWCSNGDDGMGASCQVSFASSVAAPFSDAGVTLACCAASASASDCDGECVGESRLEQ